MSKFAAKALCASLVVSTGIALATDIARQPLSTQGAVQPNVIFGMDDSGSMDFEVLLDTSDGAFWWSSVNKSGWTSAGVLDFNLGGSSSNYAKISYLFPNGCDAGGNKTLCTSDGHYAAPAVPQLAFLRSNTYNPQYYNPMVTYSPWSSATLPNGTQASFGNANPLSARSHPLYSSPSLDLTATQSSTSSDFEFIAGPGMKLPAGTLLYNGYKWVTLSSATTIGGFAYPGPWYDVVTPYYPATYWHKQACTVDDVTCTRAPDGATLRRYEIKNGVVFPSGRTYAAELQNFANWYTYYRKRKLSLAAAMGQVMDSLSGLRVGLVSFNKRGAVTMYSTDNADPAANGKVLSGLFYSNPSSGGTPTRETLSFIGEQFRTNKSIVRASCQRNAALIVTDGFANASSVTVPVYSASTWGAGSPYQTTHAGTLADLALAYYTNNLRPDLPSGRVPAAPASNKDPAADRNNNLHMNTYGLTLGAKGFLWPAIANPYTQAVNWVNPTVNASPHSIDDLWHATINGRGKMFLSTSPQQTAEGVQTALKDILKLSGSQGALTFSSVNLKAGGMAYASTFDMQGWGGDVKAYSVSPATGMLAAASTWSAAAKLDQADWTARKIASFNGTSAVAFTATNVSGLLNASNYGTAASVVDYLRGNRALESTTMRQRSALLGAVISAEPVVHPGESVVYAVTGEGMLHALDSATGAELWAYVPYSVLPQMAEQTRKTWTFQTLLDGTPVLGRAGSSTLLVGNRGAAGPGVYALDVTAPTAANTMTEVLSKVLWEFPNASTSANVKSALGTALGKPLLVKTQQYGHVVLVTSGYNSTLDGKGRLFVLDALTGALRATLVTPSGALNADAGLSQVSGFLEADGFVRYVYGGDERGNLWKFDLEGNRVTLLAQLTTSTGAFLPVTAAPELATIAGRRMVFVGTGRFLADSDFDDNLTHSFFGVWDNGSTVTRRDLAERTLTVNNSTGLRQVSGAALDWATQKGWVVTLPASEKANTDPSLTAGVVAFTTNAPSQSACASSSALYLADPGTGLALPSSAFANTAYYGMSLGNTSSARAVLTRLSSQKVGVTTRQNDGTTGTQELDLKNGKAPRKLAWKEVVR